MTNSARVPVRLPPAVLFAVITLCLAGIIWLISFSPWPMVPFRLAGQAYLMVVILLAFRYWPPMIRLVASMPVVHRVVFGVLIGTMILGHYTLSSRTYFPFVMWAIFPLFNNTDPVTCDEFIATTQDGRQVRLLVEQLFPSIVQIDPVESFKDPAREALARALASVYNEQHPANRVQRVDLMRFSVPLHPPPDESRANPSCELLKRYDVSSGR